MAKKEKKDIIPSQEMTNEEAAKWRASLAKESEPNLSLEEKREQFRLFWAKQKSQYGNPKVDEQILWLHLKSAKMEDPKKFAEGIKHFGLKKIS